MRGNKQDHDLPKKLNQALKVKNARINNTVQGFKPCKGQWQDVRQPSRRIQTGHGKRKRHGVRTWRQRGFC